MKSSFIALSLTVFWTFAGCYEQRDEALSLNEIAAAFNKKCPRMLDSETKIDGIEIRGENTVVYKYTLVNISRANIDTTEFKQALWPGILSLVKVSTDLKTLRDQQTHFQYRYQDKLNRPIYTFKIDPKDYHQQTP